MFNWLVVFLVEPYFLVMVWGINLLLGYKFLIHLRRRSGMLFVFQLVKVGVNLLLIIHFLEFLVYIFLFHPNFQLFINFFVPLQIP